MLTERLLYTEVENYSDPALKEDSDEIDVEVISNSFLFHLGT